MDFREYLTDDGHAVLALCSAFGLTEDSGPRPLTLSEWNELESELRKCSLKPSALQGRAVDQLSKDLSRAVEEAERINRLLERSGRLALELDNLFSRGMWAVTRVDDRYPTKLRDTLKHQAPTVLFGAGE